MSSITRRNLLKQSPAALAVAAIPASAAVAALPTEASPSENIDLIYAFQRFKEARDELAAAKDALEWLIDEWRHRWPLAPEEILGGANADGRFGSAPDNAERDIAGRFVFRDTAPLTTRLTRKMRGRNPRLCFSIETPEQIQAGIDRWQTPRPGRTAASIARNLVEQQRILAKYRAALPLSRAYHAETERLRKASGVAQVTHRIKVAETAFDRACRDVSHEKAYTFEGLRMKAEVLQVHDNGLAIHLLPKGGAIGGMARFIEATLDVIGRASV